MGVKPASLFGATRQSPTTHMTQFGLLAKETGPSWLVHSAPELDACAAEH